MKNWLTKPTYRSFYMTISGSFICGLIGLTLFVYGEPKLLLKVTSYSKLYGELPQEEMEQLEEDLNKYNTLWKANKNKILAKMRKDYEEFRKTKN